VRAGGAVVEDIGTRFDVRAYADDRTVRVAVAEGQVAVGGAADATPSRERPLLSAGDLGVVAGRNVAITHDADIGEEMAWSRGDLVFRNTPLREAMADVGRWYGLDVRLADPAQGQGHQLTARFSNAPAAEVLRSIAAVAGMAYTQSDRTVTYTVARPAH
jgi:transmembrane sensor